ncbi:monovalent cation:proton antiporter-2 (CPA2) family protein [Halocynthiibacter sp. C4]|uniref:monovalent cation:proton antiporter-2 (CPA2) family protein n=1 Tax=Halocynthiibacter sp. C4 TaxID=2992758 RepID=UPI00237C528E|nr:monovalent cation:proton antiporter-2 (CPA2) family protein [Halocynthiibacter sp. C4]MDE0589062.1 monovalent cation:proton antiporter-2 (CPA2) family protein [Halocynthiibacter sp. C4]
MSSFLFQATIYLGAAVIAVPVAMRLGLGSVLGYLFAGIVIGPLLGLVGSETQSLQHFAEFGVVMMLFLIGLELEPRKLWEMRHRLIGLGGLQITLTAAAVTGATYALGFDWPIALAVGLTMSLSSTAIVLQTLNEKRLMSSSGGRSSFSVLLTQDIAVIPILAFLPLLALSGIHNETAGGHGAEAQDAGPFAQVLNWFQALPPLATTSLTILAVVLIILGGIYLTRPLFRYIHGSHLPEMYTALSLLIVIAIACIMLVVGLSPALGAFLAGVVLANSEFRHQLESDIEPFKGLLLGLFFITVGAGINFGVLFGAPLQILSFTLAIILIKGSILFVIGYIFRLRGRDLWLFTLGLAQAGEFGFVIASFAIQRNVLPTDLTEQLLLVIALSMLATPLLFLLYEAISKRHKDSPAAQQEADEIDEQHPIIIAGIGRFGQVVTRLVQSAGYKTTVLDHNLSTVEVMRKFGFKGFFGDPTRPEILHAAGLDTARVLVVALDDRDAALQLVKFARKQRPDLHIIARAYDRGEVYRLYAAGANDIVREVFDSSLRAGRYVLENIGFTEYEAAEAEQAFYKYDRTSIRELAALFDPNIPSSENKPYIERSKELAKDFEAELLASREKGGS